MPTKRAMSSKRKMSQVNPDLDHLSQLVCTEQSSTSFACGGSIPVRIDKNDSDTSWARTPTEPMHSNPINVFWSSKEEDKVNKLTLPIQGNGVSDEESGISTLVRDCSPATFGRGQKDVLDESYRRAGKMDVADFATNFHPADFGLIQHAEQTLLPSVLSERENDFQAKGLIAELYKLNVRSQELKLFLRVDADS